MALLAENLVKEWMNRNGFFTIRGVRDGVAEIDLLGIRTKRGLIEAWHVESQVSFSPIGYVTPLTESHSKLLGKKKTTAWKRPPEILGDCVRGWLEKKFDSVGKTKVRERLWPGQKWKKILVHGAVNCPEELDLLGKHIHLVDFYEVLRDLCWDSHDLFAAGGTDVADIVAFYHDRAPPIEEV